MMIEGIVPPISIDPESLDAAQNSLKYFFKLCSRPIECEEYAVARGAAIRILAIQVADNNGSDHFVFSDSFSVVMDYGLVRMGRKVTFEMIANLEFHGAILRIRQIRYDQNDLMYFYVDDAVITIHVPGIFRAGKKAEFEERMSGRNGR